jgi:hypothetical protein
MVKKKTGQEEGKSEMGEATERTPKDPPKTKELSSKAVSVINAKAEVKRSKTLLQLEKQVWKGIEKGRISFLSTGEALFEIQKNKLYKETDWSTFEEYCEEKFDIKSSSVYRFIDAFKAHVEIFSPIGEKAILPILKSESQFRELVKVKGTDNQKEILTIYSRGLDPEDEVTAKGLKEVVSKHYDKTNKKVSKKEIKHAKRVNERVRLFSSKDISLEGKTFEIKSEENDVSDFLKRISEILEDGGSVEIAYKPKKKSKARS